MDPSHNRADQTHFGYEQVSTTEKPKRVAEVFHSVASQYDLMNDIMSLGSHRLWKRYAIMLADVRKGQQVLDLAGGTGDLTKQLAARVGPTGQVILSDINASMLQKGRSRLIDQGILGNVRFAQINAESLPFAKNSFDCITIGFGLRNVTYINKALASMLCCLKPGGKLIILEFSTTVLPLLKPLYDAYSFKILPRLGKWFAKDENSYRYLAESIRMHPDQETLKTMMESVGFEATDYFNLSSGIVAVHRGYKY